MYRGIIQHKTYLTDYLKKEIKDRALTKPLNCGRIYKVVPTNAPATNGPTITSFTPPADLVKLLQHPNGWVRSKAQQLLVDAKARQAIPALRQLITNPKAPGPLTLALWTLEGLNALQPADILLLLQQSGQQIRMQALSLTPSVINKSNYHQFLPVFNQILDKDDTLAAPYIAFITNTIQAFDPAKAHELLITLARKYPNNIYVADAIISNLYNKEAAFYKETLALNPDTSLALNRRLKKVLTDIEKAKNTSNLAALEKEYPRGAKIFQSVCQTCHGTDGNGITALGPPLNGSNWVQGDKNKLIPIVLYGLTGPIKIAGKLYKSPEINGDMPGIGANKEFTDEDIAQTLNFIRNSWNNKAGKITAPDIGTVRKKFNSRPKPFTMEELER
jgi:mono/diheme cytochrome c family protein